MTRFHHVVSIILLALFLTVGIVNAAEGGANLSVSKVVSSAAPYKTGQPVTWVVTLSNNGPEDATNISLTENISGFSGHVMMSGAADPPMITPRRSGISAGLIMQHPPVSG